jgi:hypothetical protein
VVVDDQHARARDRTVTELGPLNPWRRDNGAHFSSFGM